jgi:glycosyltransferase involved in cell wall biosynthesis
MGISGILAAFIEKISVLTADRIISVSSHTTKRLIEDLNFKRKINTIALGINYQEIKNVKKSDQKSDVIFAGRLLSHKNVDVLIKAINILKSKSPDIKCFIVGEGPEKEKLQKLAEDFNLSENINFFDFFSDHKDLYSLMKSSKVFVLPSTREGFGIVLVEANACGIPVVTINHKDNAAKDLVINDKRKGLVCELDEYQVAKSISQVLAKGKAFDELSKELESYDWDIITSQIEYSYSI